MLSLREFALKAVKKLRDEVWDAKGLGAIGFCMALVSNLDMIVPWLESVPDPSSICELLRCLDDFIHVGISKCCFYKKIKKNKKNSTVVLT
jgi:hypothetical protein